MKRSILKLFQQILNTFKSQSLSPHSHVILCLFYPNPRFPSPSNLANTENPGTSRALKRGYLEEYRALKIGYPEEHVTLKSGYRKRLLHWKVATGRSCYIENWLPGKETKSISRKESYLLWNKHSIIVRRQFLYSVLPTHHVKVLDLLCNNKYLPSSVLARNI